MGPRLLNEWAAFLDTEPPIEAAIEDVVQRAVMAALAAQGGDREAFRAFTMRREERIDEALAASEPATRQLSPRAQEFADRMRRMAREKGLIGGKEG